MKFEILKKNHLKRNLLIGIATISILTAGILTFTKAKYKTTESIPLVNGTINYTLADLNIVSLYIDGIAINNLALNYNSDTKTFIIAPYTAKGIKCILYFEEILKNQKDSYHRCIRRHIYK